MYTVRLLPLGAPLAVIIPVSGHGLVIALSILGLLVTLLVVRQISRALGPTEDPRA